MGVYLKDLKLPDGDPITINIYRDGSWVDAYTTEDGMAIDVPEPHGRLIDAVLFKENMDYVCDAGGWLEPVTTAVKDYVRKNIDSQSTVIPGSEEYY